MSINYNENGDITSVDDERFIYCKVNKIGRNPEKYYIRTENSFFSDPNSMYVNQASGGLSLNDKLRSKFTFRQVSKEVFDVYLHYLKTKKKVFLRQAEREFKCG